MKRITFYANLKGATNTSGPLEFTVDLLPELVEQLSGPRRDFIINYLFEGKFPNTKIRPEEVSWKEVGMTKEEEEEWKERLRSLDG